MGFIPEDVIAQVIDRSDIVSVIGSYIPLKPAGRNLKALCPFHHEKTPSFIVNPDKQIYHCFGCHAGGNVISFVMQQERLEFPEAVRLLAEKGGISIPTQAQPNAKGTQIKAQLKKINALALEYYHQNLLADKSSAAGAAREYLQSRGLTLATVKKFHLGFALEQWDGLLEFLRRRNVPLALIEKAGLVIAKNRSDGYYDRFRKRVIFPILNSKGECVAFGGRALPGNDEDVKYLNSPETPVYVKGENLYGFCWAKEGIGRSDEAVVVEGYLDFVMPFQAGIGNIVASLGTALTVEQIRLVRRYTHNIIMLYDADPAGQNAILRSLDILIDEGMNVRIAILEEGEDPDSYVRKCGSQRFQERIREAESVFDFKLKFLQQQNGNKTTEARGRISDAMLATISRFQNAVVKAEYIKRLAQTLFVAPDILQQEMDRMARRALTARRGEEAPLTQHTTVVAAARPAEQNLVRLMLESPEFIEPTRLAAEMSDFQDQVLSRIVAKIFELFDQKGQIRVPELMSCFSEPAILNTISALVASEEALAGDRKKIHQDCLCRLKQERLRSRRFLIRQAMEEARSSGDFHRLTELMHEFNQLIKNKGLLHDAQRTD